MKLFSAFAAATLLERDRQTIIRALRNVAQDGAENGQPRWKLSTIVAALQRNSTSGTTAATSNPLPECAMFNQAFAALVALPTLPARREAAIKIMPVLNAMVGAVGAAGCDPDAAGARGDLLYQTSLAGFQGPCEWTRDQVWEYLNLDTDAECS
jgi:hypothetical protein